MMIKQIENITGEEVIPIDRVAVIDSLVDLCEAYKREAEANHEAMIKWFRRAIEAEAKLKAVENIQAHAHKASDEQPFLEESNITSRWVEIPRSLRQEERWDKLIEEAKEKGLLEKDDERHLSDIHFNISERESRKPRMIAKQCCSRCA